MTLFPVYASGCQVWLHHRINTRYKNYQAIVNCSQRIHSEGNLTRISHPTCKLPAIKGIPDGCRAHPNNKCKTCQDPGTCFHLLFLYLQLRSVHTPHPVHWLPKWDLTRWNRAATTASMKSHKWPSWQQMDISYKSIPPSLISQPGCSRKS